MRLVLRYSGGDYDSYFDEWIPVEYESKEKLREDIFVAVRETIERFKNRKTWTIEQWQADSARARKESTGPDRSFDQDKYNALIKEMGYGADYYEIVIGGRRLLASAFCVGHYEGLRDECLTIDEEVEILTLDEWFSGEEAIKG